ASLVSQHRRELTELRMQLLRERQQADFEFSSMKEDFTRREAAWLQGRDVQDSYGGSLASLSPLQLADVAEAAARELLSSSPAPVGQGWCQSDVGWEATGMRCPETLAPIPEALAEEGEEGDWAMALEEVAAAASAEEGTRSCSPALGEEVALKSRSCSPARRATPPLSAPPIPG
ncbi:unnamed protein product, partial [Polarella glacialis]